MKQQGVPISCEQASLIFNKETEKGYEIIIEHNVDSVDPKMLINYLCKQSWENTRRAQRSGKKAIQV